MSDNKSSQSDPFGVNSLVDGITRRVGTALDIASKTTEFAVNAINRTPEQLEMMGQAGKSLKDLRQVAGLTISEVAETINLKDEKMLEEIEAGRAAISFEIILRLASLYARNDPLPFALKYARTYSPGIWEMMERLGLDKLPLQYERERAFINIYRSADQARQLSDESFNEVLDFTARAFDMALHFAAQQEEKEPETNKKAKESASKSKTTAGKKKRATKKTSP